MHKAIRNYNNILENKIPNDLIHAASPYLQQHAYQQIQWMPWSQKALDLAMQHQKLLIVSIGYSACHWCHVMANTSFEDQASIDFMNQHFICIKVDREEHIDIDQYYMEACQLINGNGGWPLNAICLPDKRPIHVITYAPPEAWLKTLEHVQTIWHEEPAKAYAYAEQLSHGVQTALLPPNNNHCEAIKTIDVIANSLSKIDDINGGLKGAPKFPMPGFWQYLLHCAEPKSTAFELTLLTLNKMSMGALYDVIDGGFCRYSVDAQWHIPHFEKMLYDNAQMIGLYALAYQQTLDQNYADIAKHCLHFARSQWLNEWGLYYAATDADSEHEEGQFYTFTWDELTRIIDTDFGWFSDYQNMTKTGNFEKGRNALIRKETLETYALANGMDGHNLKARLQDCYARIKTHKTHLIRPQIDTKSILHWNTLMLSTHCHLARVFKDQSHVKSATELIAAIEQHFHSEGQWFRIHSHGEASVEAYFEDLANLIDAYIQLYQILFDETLLIKAKTLLEFCIEHHYNSQTGFFYNQQDSLSPVYPTTDDIMSCGNSVMAHNLNTLSWLFEQRDWQDMAKSMLQNMTQLLLQSSPWFANWAKLAYIYEHGLEQWIMVSHEKPSKLFSLSPNQILAWSHTNTQIPLLKNKPIQAEAMLHKCINELCLLPIPLKSVQI